MNKYLYYNADLVNSNTTDSGYLPLLVFNENRTEDILNDTTNYKMSIVSWQMNSSDYLPLFIPQIDTTATDPVNTTIYQITIQIFTNSTTPSEAWFSVPLMWQNSKGLTSPQFAGQNNHFDDPYYFMYSYGEFVNMVNTALKASFTEVCTQLGNYTPSSKCPFLVYDSNTNKFSFMVDTKGQTTSEDVNIFVNTPLKMLLNNFYYRQTELGGVIVHNLTIDNNIINNVVSGSDTYLRMEQEWSSCDNFSPISSIVVKSLLINCRPEYNGQIKILNNISSNVLSSQNLNDDYITDMKLVQSNGGQDYKQLLTYEPSIYRFINLDEETRLRNIGFSFNWKCKFDGNIYPIYLPISGHCSVKFLFEKV